MATYKTKRDETLLYKGAGAQEGKIHSASPIKGAGTRVEVQGNAVNIAQRGACWRLINPDNAYVLIGDLESLTNPEPPPPPPPSNMKEPFTLKVTGYKLFSGELEKE